MGNTTGIEWCDSTINCWIGCTRVSPACDNCYAAEYGNRFGIPWDAKPRRTHPRNLAKIAAYQRGAAAFHEQHGRRRRVFINSLSDFFDNRAEDEWRVDACREMDLAPDVTFILVTKRPQNITKMVPNQWLKHWPRHVWIMTTAENQQEYNRRVPHLLTLPGKPAVIGLSMEPLLEDIGPRHSISYSAHERAVWCTQLLKRPIQSTDVNELGWIIIGGESGTDPRPMPPLYRVIDLACQFAATRHTSVFVKQLSEADYPFSFRNRERWSPALAKFTEHPDD